MKKGKEDADKKIYNICFKCAHSKSKHWKFKQACGWLGCWCKKFTSYYDRFVKKVEDEESA